MNNQQGKLLATLIRESSYLESATKCVNDATRRYEKSHRLDKDLMREMSKAAIWYDEALRGFNKAAKAYAETLPPMSFFE